MQSKSKSKIPKIINFYKTNKKYFDRMAKGHGAHYYGSILRFLGESNLNLSDRKILDIGCGAGTLVNVLKSKFKDIEAYGTDVSDLGRPEKVLSFRKSNAEKLPYKDHIFDNVFIIDVLEHTINPKKVLVEAKRVLKRGGYIVIRLPNYSCPFINGQQLDLLLNDVVGYYLNINKGLNSKKSLVPDLTGNVGGDTDAISGIGYGDMVKELTNLNFKILKSETWGGGSQNSKVVRLLNYIPVLKILGSVTTIIARLS